MYMYDDDDDDDDDLNVSIIEKQMVMSTLNRNGGIHFRSKILLKIC